MPGGWHWVHFSKPLVPRNAQYMDAPALTRTLGYCLERGSWRQWDGPHSLEDDGQEEAVERGVQVWPREPRSIRYIINWAKDLTEYRCGRRFSEMYSWYLAATCASSDTDRYKSSDAVSGSPPPPQSIAH